MKKCATPLLLSALTALAALTASASPPAPARPLAIRLAPAADGLGSAFAGAHIDAASRELLTQVRDRLRTAQSIQVSTVAIDTLTPEVPNFHCETTTDTFAAAKPNHSNRSHST